VQADLQKWQLRSEGDRSNEPYCRSGVPVCRFWWWCLSSHCPRLVASRLVKRRSSPLVRGTLASSHLTKRLQNVNVLAPTNVCRVMAKFGSDKTQPNTPQYILRSSRTGTTSPSESLSSTWTPTIQTHRQTSRVWEYRGPPPSVAGPFRAQTECNLWDPW
jgi:hypothetical protein